MQTLFGGYTTKVTFDGVPYTLHTKEGIRGFNIPCTAWFDGKYWNVTVNGRYFTVTKVMCDIPGCTSHRFSKYAGLV